MKAKLQVLVVEDSRIVRERLIQKLSRMKDLEVTASGDFKEGLALFKKGLPELVILDIQLPDGNGLDLLEAMKNHRLATVAVVLTNHSSTRIRRQAAEKGADFFFDKSTQLDEMFAAVTHWQTARTQPHRGADQ